MHFRLRIGSFLEQMCLKHRDDSILAITHAGDGWWFWITFTILDHTEEVKPGQATRASPTSNM